VTNLYRLFHKLKGHPDVRRREALFHDLAGKTGFSSGDVERVLEYRHLPFHHNPHISRYAEKAFHSEDLGAAVKLLRRIPGVGMAVASSLLMFHNPYKYAELDHESWRVLREEYGFEGTGKDTKSDYGLPEYERYLEAIRKLAEEHGMRVADVQLTLRLSQE